MDATGRVQCALQIERLAADRRYGDVLTLLRDLLTAQVTAEQLQTTDVVRVLYRVLRTCPDRDVKKTVKSLLSKWKRQYSQDARGEKCTGGRKEPELGCTADLPQKAESDGAEQRVEAAAGHPASPSVENDGPQPAESGPASSDFPAVRVKCVELLVSALRPEPADRDRAALLAGDVERHIHQRHSSSQARYKTCVRSKVANLRNPKHAHLRQGLLCGSLSPQAFARMSAEEMAGAELRQLREEYSSRGVSERQLPQGVEGTHTQKIRCKRCGGWDCRVTQVSRGALFLPAWVRRGGPDDDAVTFVTCSGCGQQWYHSGWVCL